MTDPLIPRKLEEFIGQSIATRQITLELIAALRESRMPRHLLAYGPPGTGKSTVAELVWKELDLRWHPVTFYRCSGPEFDTVTKAREVLWSLARGNDPLVVLMDECDGMPRGPAYVWYSVLTHNAFPESGRMITLPPLCLIATTNHPGAVARALRSRFALRLGLSFYPAEDLATIAKAAVARLNVTISDEAAAFLGANAGGEPRRVLQLVQHAANLSQVIDEDTAREALSVLDLFPGGLTRLQIEYLLYLAQAPRMTAGLQTICSALGESKSDVEVEHEMFLLRRRMVEVTSGGRRLAADGLAYLEALA